MELRHLRSFLTVAQCCNVTRASVELGYSQQAISLHIAALERELGVRLFTRDRGGCALTEAGVDLLCRVIGPVTALEAVNLEEFVRRYGADGEPMMSAGVARSAVRDGVVRG